jgi:hypothetical protein
VKIVWQEDESVKEKVATHRKKITWISSSKSKEMNEWWQDLLFYFSSSCVFGIFRVFVICATSAVRIDTIDWLLFVFSLQFPSRENRSLSSMASDDVKVH